MLPVPFGAFASRKLTALANNTNLSTTITASASSVHFGKSTHYFPGGGRNIRVAFSNWYLLTNGEHPGYYDFYLEATLLYKGVFYPLTFNGASSVLVSANFGNVLSDPIVDSYGNPVIIDPKSIVHIENTRSAADGGASSSYNALVSFSGSTFRQDGDVRTNTTTPDYTQGVGVVTDAVMAPLTAAQINPTNGSISSAAILTPGSGYPSAPSLYGYYGAAGAGNPGALVPGSGLVGYANLTSGVPTSITISSGGTGHSPANPPQLVLDPGGYATTQAWGPSAIIGESLLGLPGTILVGDSITAGFGSVDGNGDILGSWGWYEQLLAPHFGVQKMAVSGESAQGWVQNKANQLAFLRFLAANGYAPEVFCNALSTNDFLTNLNANSLTATQAFLNGMANSIKGIFPRIKVMATTCLPCNKTTSTANRFTTVAEQIPYNANFVAGGNVDQFNADLRSKGGAVNYDYLLDGNIVARDATTTTAWRTDAYAGVGPNPTPACAYCNTNDGSDANGPGGATEYFGIHPIPGVGIAHLVKNVVIPAIPASPVINGSIATQQAAVSQAFSYTPPVGMIVDPGGLALTYSATLADGTPLPSWLTCNPTTGALTGTPAWTNRGTISVRVFAKNTANFRNFITVPIWVDNELAFISEAYYRSDLNQLTVDGSNLVSKWADASGHGVTMAQGTSTFQPKYMPGVVDGHGAVRSRWDGSNPSQLSFADNPILKYGAFATFTVLRRWADMNAVEAFAGKWNSGTREWYAEITAADKAGGFVSGSQSSGPNAIPAGATSLALGATYVIETGWDGTNAYVRLNGGPAVNVAQSAVYNGNSTYYLLSLDTTKSFPAAVDMLEHAFIIGGVTSTQRAAILARMMAEFPSIAALGTT